MASQTLALCFIKEQEEEGEEEDINLGFNMLPPPTDDGEGDLIPDTRRHIDQPEGDSRNAEISESLV
jgi:hypothetical protein